MNKYPIVESNDLQFLCWKLSYDSFSLLLASCIRYAMYNWKLVL